jgi:ketosteroid isomerase-like protein
MSIEDNRKLAVKFVKAMGKDGKLCDERLITDDFRYWAAHHHALMNVREMNAMLANLTQMPVAPELSVIRTIAEADQVALEVSGRCTLPNGTPYNNHYLFIILVRDGRIREVREYCDTKLASDCLGTPDLAAMTRKSAEQISR